MRRWLALTLLLVVLALAYLGWPFVGLYQLGSALRAADVEDALRRVDIPSVRRSIIAQLVDEASLAAEAEGRLGDLGRQIAVSAATSELDRQLAAVITPDVLREMIVEGDIPPAWAEGLGLDGGPAAGTDRLPMIGVPENPFGLIQGWGFSSIRRFKTVLGPAGKPEEWTGVRMRLRGFTWRLSGIDLSPSVLTRVKPIVRRKIEALRR